MMMGKGMAGIAGGAGRMGMGFAAGPWGLLVQVGLVLLVVAIVYFVAINKKKKKSEYLAMQSLKLKFVEGEITEQEYHERKEVLTEK